MRDLAAQNAFPAPERSAAGPDGVSGRPGALEVNDFLRAFSAALLAVGAQTARVDRNVARIARAFGYEVDLAVFPKHLMISVTSLDGKDRRTSVGSIQSGAPDFQKLADLNSLGWRIVDESLSLAQASECFKAILNGPRVDPAQLRFLVACANAAFCRLFGGDAAAMGLVFAATLIGFLLRQLLARWGVDGKIIFFLCAFAASLLASPGVIFHWGATPETALASSVLFLIPGIPLINALLDIGDGHVLMGFARAVIASIFIICIALGLALTMMILGVNTL